jgi:hypothetical protein
MSKNVFMLEYLYIALFGLFIIVQTWAIIDVIYRIFKLGTKFKTYWIWIVLFLPVIGAIFYFQRKRT